MAETDPRPVPSYTDGCGGVEVVDEVLQRVHHVGVHVVEGDGQVAAAVQTLHTVGIV